MLFNRHAALEGKHALLSPSNYHWLNYDDHKLEAKFHSVNSARRGTDLHALAHEAIRLRVPLASENQALSDYVNDAIAFEMQCEQPLYYSDNCFGTADALSFTERLLRVHDLKTGIIVTSFKQLEVYDGLFCIEYGVDPFEIEHELRIYQRDEIRIHIPTPEGILAIMDKIIESDLKIETIREANRW